MRCDQWAWHDGRDDALALLHLVLERVLVLPLLLLLVFLLLEAVVQRSLVVRVELCANDKRRALG